MRSAIRLLTTLCVAGCFSACGSDAPRDPPDRDSATDREPASFPTRDLVDIEIDVDPDDWNLIRAEGRTINSVYSGCAGIDFDYTTVRGSVRIDGRDFGRVALRKKGFLGSLSMNRPSLRIELDAVTADQRWLGSKTVVLNNGRQDPSFTHQCMAYAMFRAAGVPASDCGFARVELNGELLGYYILIEPIKKPFLRRHFGDDSGELFEGTAADFREDRLMQFERKNNGPDERSDILERVTAALADPGDDLPARLESLIDLPLFLRFWAVETLIAHWDGYTGDTNNFYLYVQPDSGKLAFIPWGTDGAFDHDHKLLPEVGRPQAVFAVSRLARRLYELPETREMFRDTLRELLERHWNEDELLEDIDRIAALIPAADPQALDAQREFVRGRRSELQAELDGEAPVWPFPERMAFECRPDLNTDLSGTFEIPWDTLGAPVISTMNTLELTVDGVFGPRSPVLAAAGMAEASQDTLPSLQLLVPQAGGRTLVVQLYVGLRPLVPGEVRFHGLETYGVVLDARDRDHYAFKGFVGDGAIWFDDVGTSTGSMLRGRVEARVVALAPALADVLSTP